MSLRVAAAVLLLAIRGLFWAAVELLSMRLVFAAMRVHAAASLRSVEHGLAIYLRSGMHAGSAVRRAQRDHANTVDIFDRAIHAQMAADDADARVRFCELEIERLA